MLEEICGYLHNYFTAREDIHAGEYAIEGGSMDLPFLAEGQYFRIVGSALNDGVYQYPIDGTDEAQALADEAFTGEVWAMKVPKAVRALAAEIEGWQRKYGAAALSPYQSESFAGYSYTKATGSGSGAGGGWQAAFAAKLKRWKKIRE